jgi:hypothetical protein
MRKLSNIPHYLPPGYWPGGFFIVTWTKVSTRTKLIALLYASHLRHPFVKKPRQGYGIFCIFFDMAQMSQQIR